MIAVVISEQGHADFDTVMGWALEKALKVNARIQLMHQKRSEAMERVKKQRK